MSAIKAIETHYAGHRFRSRLEARWAVFFDALGIEWLYEDQGYLVGERMHLEPKPYLPDFYLPREQVWVEVKGDTSTVDMGYLLAAAIELAESDEPRIDRNRPSLLCLGQLPQPEKRDNARLLHSVLRHHKGYVHVELMAFAKGRLRYDEDVMAWGPREIGADEQGVLDVPWAKPRHLFSYLPMPGDGTPAVTVAYAKARKARFEHGERG